jgi:hypothetical protein
VVTLDQRAYRFWSLWKNNQNFEWTLYNVDVKKLHVIVAFLLFSSSALATETMSFIAPEGTITNYRTETNIVFSIPKLTSTTSNGSKADVMVGKQIQKNLDGFRLQIADDFTETVNAIPDELNVLVNTTGNHEINTSMAGATTSVAAPYQSKTIYQTDGFVKLEDFVFDTSQLESPYDSLIKAQEADEVQDRNAGIARLYGLDLELGKDIAVAPSKSLAVLDPDINLTPTYKFLGRDDENSYFFDINTQSSLVSKPINGYSFKIFFKLMPAVGTGKISFLYDGRLLHEEYDQTTPVIYTYIFTEGKISTTHRLEGTISLKRQTDITE